MNSLVLLNYICMCIKHSTTIQTQLASSVSLNSSLLLSNYLETAIRGLHGSIGDASALVWGEGDAKYFMNLCKAVVLVEGSEGLVEAIPLLVEVLDFLAVVLPNVEGLDTYRELILREGEKEVGVVESCLACAGDIMFSDVTDAICVNGHEWSMCDMVLIV
jgi:hypothetical protein